MIRSVSFNLVKRAIFWGVILFLVFYFGVAKYSAQESRPVVIRSSDFVLTKEQSAAGIDGRIKISLDVDEKGAVKDANVVAGPIWPCYKAPKKELNDFKSAVTSNARLFKFDPAMKNGKPIKSNIVLTVTVGEAYKASMSANGPVKVGDIQYIDVGVVNGRAISISKPSWPVYWTRTRSYAAEDFIVSIDVIINHEGKVVSAGTLSGPKEF